MNETPMKLNDDDHEHTKSVRQYAAALFVVVTIAGLSQCSSRHAHGQESTRSDEDRRALLHLADTVSRVCAHESSFVSMSDCLMVWQAARRHGDTAEARTAWLYVHSPCALRGARCGTGRHQGDPGHWSSALPLSGDEEPAGWPDTLSWATYAPRWASIRRIVRRLIRGDLPPGGWPCEEDPDTWGGRVYDAEHIRLNAAHLREIDCRDRATGQPTRNAGFRWI